VVDPRSFPILRQKGLQERLGLGEEEKIEVGRPLALTLDPDQEDLFRMFANQNHADRDRLRELEDPAFDDDPVDWSDGMTRFRSIAARFEDKAAPTLDHVLTPGQRAALFRRPSRFDPDMFEQFIIIWYMF
jgi:hypothetical protein